MACMTGASGYIAAWLVKLLIQRGYTVKATVRDTSQCSLSLQYPYVMWLTVLQEIIGENQSTFVAERLITDNVLVAHELMSHISKKKKGKCGEMTVKLDMSKGYDQLNVIAYNKSCRSLVSINNGLAL